MLSIYNPEDSFYSLVFFHPFLFISSIYFLIDFLIKTQWSLLPIVSYFILPPMLFMS